MLGGWRWAEAAAVTPVWAVLGLRPRPPAGAHKVSVLSSTADNNTTAGPQQLYPALASLRRAAVIRVTHVAARRPEIRVLLFCGSGDCD